MLIIDMLESKEKLCLGEMFFCYKTTQFLRFLSRKCGKIKESKKDGIMHFKENRIEYCD